MKNSDGQLFQVTPAEPKILRNKGLEETNAIKLEGEMARATAVEAKSIHKMVFLCCYMKRS